MRAWKWARERVSALVERVAIWRLRRRLRREQERNVALEAELSQMPRWARRVGKRKAKDRKAPGCRYCFGDNRTVCLRSARCPFGYPGVKP